jgi:hypothetical protein
VIDEVLTRGYATVTTGRPVGRSCLQQTKVAVVVENSAPCSEWLAHLLTFLSAAYDVNPLSDDVHV